MHKSFRYCALFLLGLLAGCVTNNRIPLIQVQEPIIKKTDNPVRQVVLLLDGTENDLRSKTNISILGEIIKNQAKDNLYIFYKEGVGTNGETLGAATGYGIDQDIEEAYAFVAKNYSPGSELYMFGFSRGAYTARIVAGMIRTVGIYDLSSVVRNEERVRIARELYVTYKQRYSHCNGLGSGTKEAIEKCVRLAAAATRKVFGRIHPIYPAIPLEPYKNVSIKALGLWDTVEALGIVHSIWAAKRSMGIDVDLQNIVNPNYRYLDQVCNAQHVYHALSLDDDRANIITPVILTSDYVAAQCTPEESALEKIEEVWFSGAHSDVGGGYSINEGNRKGDFTNRDLSLSGISLNWMMSKLKRDAPNLLPENASAFANPYAFSHEARNGSVLYAYASRDDILDKYLKLSRYKKLRIHYSVVQRLAQAKSDEQAAAMGYDSEWYRKGKLAQCFEDAGNHSYRFVESCPYIEVVY
ncbi:MAG TPA: DUF2235 domain-containing protein [Gallionellaceae bacterium]